MSRKRYFFVHLAIFVAVCGTFAIAGLSSYQDFVEAERQAIAETRTGAESPVARPTRTAPEIPILALSAQ